MSTAIARSVASRSPSSQRIEETSVDSVKESLLSKVILIVGSPRSGTTWLGKIFDSHPAVRYRHEPDESPSEWQDVDPSSFASAVRRWIKEPPLRTVAKLPLFRKSWESRAGHFARLLAVYLLSAAASLPFVGQSLARAPLPEIFDVDDADVDHARTAIKSIRLSAGAYHFARAYPEGRTCLIVRHPCGQVESVMRGVSQGRFDAHGDEKFMPYNEDRAMACAARRGLTAVEFHALPAAAKYAWAWVAFNETALDALHGLPNARIVIYEDLCADPEAVSRELFAFAGLPWCDQTAAFVNDSAHGEERSSYYSVYRDAAAAAEGWRMRMSPEDQRAVRQVVAQSTLARLWPDLSATST
jgi:hypothetical protein